MPQSPCPATDCPEVPSANALRSRFLRDVFQLIVVGLAMEAVFVLYVVAYPLISNTQGADRIFDLEKLTRGNQWFAAVYFVGMLLLFYLFWRAIRLAKDICRMSLCMSHDRVLKSLVLGFGLLFGFTLVWLYPVTANDLFRYVLRGRVWTIYGESPMLSPPSDFPNDPYILFAGEFGDWVSGYGPLWEILVQVPLRLGATDMVSGAIGLKFLVLFFYLLSVVVLGWLAWPAQGTSGRESWIPLTGLIIFAWNPLVLMEGLGNGHNDMVLLALMIAGVVLWERKLWWAAATAFSLAALTKAPGLLLLPLFGVALLEAQPTWRQRVLKGVTILCIFLALTYLLYSAVGPVSETLRGVMVNLTQRRGYAIASSLRVVLREIVPRQIAEPIPRTTGRYLFILFYVGLLIQVWRKRLNLTVAAFLAYFAQLMLGRTFRIWYPIWLVPLAALYPIPATYWRMFLFCLSAELYAVNTILWRWWLNNWAWGKEGPLGPYWKFWTIINVMALPWFMVPLFGPLVIRWWEKKKRTRRHEIHRA